MYNVNSLWYVYVSKTLGVGGITFWAPARKVVNAGHAKNQQVERKNINSINSLLYNLSILVRLHQRGCYDIFKRLTRFFI